IATRPRMSAGYFQLRSDIRRISNLSRLAGVSEAGTRWRNPERSEGPPMQEPSLLRAMVGTAGLELEPFSGRERSGNPLAKSRAQRGTSPARAKATANLVGTAGLEPATSCV